MPHTICGGLPTPLKRADIHSAVQAPRLFELLQRDAEWLASAVTREQQKVMGVRPNLDSDAVWRDDEESSKADRQRERDEVVRLYRQRHGEDPPEVAHPGQAFLT
jgi:hypothetical protein